MSVAHETNDEQATYVQEDRSPFNAVALAS
jgi:hypothetical protein